MPDLASCSGPQCLVEQPARRTLPDPRLPRLRSRPRQSGADFSGHALTEKKKTASGCGALSAVSPCFNVFQCFQAQSTLGTMLTCVALRDRTHRNGRKLLTSLPVSHRTLRAVIADLQSSRAPALPSVHGAPGSARGVACKGLTRPRALACDMQAAGLRCLRLLPPHTAP